MTNQEAKERITLVHCWTDINNNPTVNSYECSLYMNNDGLCEDCEYHIAIECIEKQIPKKPINRWTGNETVIECPNCRRYPFDLSEYQWARQFCGNCGQAILWESDNE